MLLTQHLVRSRLLRTVGGVNVAGCILVLPLLLLLHLYRILISAPDKPGRFLPKSSLDWLEAAVTVAAATSSTAASAIAAITAELEPFGIGAEAGGCGLGVGASCWG